MLAELSLQDQLWSSILDDKNRLAGYLQQAQSRSTDALNHTLEWLDKMKIKYINPVAGHFIWIDLRPYLPKTGKDGQALANPVDQESALFERILFDQNVYVAPGIIYHSPTPGFFRLTFTLRRVVLDEALKRVEKALKDVQALNAK